MGWKTVQFNLKSVLEEVERIGWEVARLYGFHPTLFPRWKKQFEEKGQGIFEDRKTDESQKKIEELTRMIGKKEIEIELLKKFLIVFH